jgi:hypothetical protein
VSRGQRFIPFRYDDLTYFLSRYPEEAPVRVDNLSDDEREGPFEQAPLSVGQVLARCRSKPPTDVPRFALSRGKAVAVGILFGKESPVLCCISEEEASD